MQIPRLQGPACQTTTLGDDGQEWSSELAVQHFFAKGINYVFDIFLASKFVQKLLGNSEGNIWKHFTAGPLLT